MIKTLEELVDQSHGLIKQNLNMIEGNNKLIEANNEEIKRKNNQLKICRILLGLSIISNILIVAGFLLFMNQFTVINDVEADINANGHNNIGNVEAN